MRKSFFIRIDLESGKGIKEGLPNLLKLFKEENVKGSFYLTMGGEANLVEILKHRGKIDYSKERKIKIWGLHEKMRMVLFPQDFVERNKEILKKILEEGHEIGIHGWKHRSWTRGLNKISIGNEINKAIKKYEKIFKKRPVSFCAPAMNTNPRVLEILEENQIKFISDFPGEKTKFYRGIKNVPVTLMGEKNSPFIEDLFEKGLRDEQILEGFKEKIKGKEIASFYIHGLFEAREKIELLRKMIKVLKKEGFENKRIIDY